ncbi:MAG: hypothetical protein ACXWNC_04330, partial [Anaerolineales bacterium]
MRQLANHLEREARKSATVNSTGNKNTTFYRYGLKLGTSRAWPLIVIISLTILYVVIFTTNYGNYGLFISPLIAIPVILAGWFYGINWGLFASIVAIILNSALFMLTFENGWNLWMGFSWSGNIMVVLVGYIAGRFKRVFDEHLKTENQLRSRERYLALINLAVHDVLSFKNLDDKYHYVISHLANLFVADYALLTRWDTTQERAILIAATAPLKNNPFSGIVLDPGESTITASVLLTETPLVIEDVPGSHYIITPIAFKDLLRPASSALG